MTMGSGTISNQAPGGRPASAPRRVVVLFSRLSGYMATCLQTLQERHGVRLMVVRQAPAADAPFAARHFSWIEALHDRDALRGDALREAVTAFEPDAVFMSGWFDRDYLAVARHLKARGVPVVAGSDAQWTGSPRQQVARVIAPWYLHPAIDVLWVAGERQRQLAAALGYRGARLWDGVYACDWRRFSAVHEAHGAARPHAFLFVGRYVPVKGLDVLVEAYRRYRARVPDPWPLICAGTGAQRGLLEGQEGIVDRGFVQPDALPDLMAEAGAFVLASRREPWGVVVQEAAAAGLPLIVSDACGAAVHLLSDRFNGFTFANGDADHLAACMVRMSAMEAARRVAMQDASHALSRQYTPERWADTLLQGIEQLRGVRAQP